VVVDVGLAIGLAIFGLFNPVLGDQEYTVPPLAVKLVEVPAQIETSCPAFAVIEPTETITLSVAEQPLFVTITV
jgi:hypothetical protein